MPGTRKRKETYNPPSAVMREHEGGGFIHSHCSLKGEQANHNRGRELYLRYTSRHFMSSCKPPPSLGMSSSSIYPLPS